AEDEETADPVALGMVVKWDVTDPVNWRATRHLSDWLARTWTDHFVWSQDYLSIVGTTAIGRATIETLQLNRTGVVNLRKLLILARLHPPS
ncbi:MAG: hypothetical protein AAF329_11545, partial [Cyanobacteria bacterium P01_A01_bin.17]